MGHYTLAMIIRAVAQNAPAHSLTLPAAFSPSLQVGGVGILRSGRRLRLRKQWLLAVRRSLAPLIRSRSPAPPARLSQTPNAVRRCAPLPASALMIDLGHPHAVLRTLLPCPQLLMMVAIAWLSYKSRVDAHPLIKTNLSTTILLKPINGARNAPLDASLFNKISLLKAWPVFPAARPLLSPRPLGSGRSRHSRETSRAGRGQKLFETKTR